MSTAEEWTRKAVGDRGDLLVNLWDGGEVGRGQLLTVFRVTDQLAAATAAAWLAGQLMERNVADWSEFVEFLKAKHGRLLDKDVLARREYLAGSVEVPVVGRGERVVPPGDAVERLPLVGEGRRLGVRANVPHGQRRAVHD